MASSPRSLKNRNAIPLTAGETQLKLFNILVGRKERLLHNVRGLATQVAALRELSGRKLGGKRASAQLSHTGHVLSELS